MRGVPIVVELGRYVHSAHVNCSCDCGDDQDQDQDQARKRRRTLNCPELVLYCTGCNCSCEECWVGSVEKGRQIVFGNKTKTK
jgi:hypothetical protein